MWLVQAGNAWRLLFSRKRRAELVVSCAVAFFSQINVRVLPCLSCPLLLIPTSCLRGCGCSPNDIHLWFWGLLCCCKSFT